MVSASGTRKVTGEQEQASLVGVCPSCQHRTTFRYGGEQRWPEKVARSIGVPSVVKLWHCQHCHSTFTETEIDH